MRLDSDDDQENEMTTQKTMFVRYLGNKACWTVSDGRFYIGSREELTDQERELCQSGGGDLPLSVAIDAVAY